MRSAAMQSLTNDIKAENPGVTIWGIGDAAHKKRASDHNEDDTAGSRPAQSDADSVPEHRAIDVKVDGSAFTDSKAQSLISRVLAVPGNRARLRYINYKNTQWHMNTGFKPHDNSDDPHPTHIHFSGLASKDEDGSPWLTGGDEMELRATRGMGQNGAPPSDNTMFLQRSMNYVIEGDPRLAEHPLAVDGNYGGQTAYWVSVLLTGGDGNLVDGNQFGILGAMVADRRTANALTAHAATPHSGELPESVQMTIPAYTVPAQTVTVPIEE